jgi:hypothetical protein
MSVRASRYVLDDVVFRRLFKIVPHDHIVCT